MFERTERLKNSVSADFEYLLSQKEYHVSHVVSLQIAL
jgi:uncharacterized membrane protein YciS (DUF1049 family)